MLLHNLFWQLLHDISQFLIIVGGSYVVFWMIFKRFSLKYRCQNLEFTKQDMWREASWSLITKAIFAVNAVMVTMSPWLLKTKIYKDVDLHGWPWIIISFFLLMLYHDAFAYWTHRLMHLPYFYEKIHSVHHVSKNPSPWAVFTFHPLEAQLLAVWILPLLFLIPLHTHVIAAFILFSLLVALSGHLGIWILPSWTKHPILGWKPPAHNLHHSHQSVNYGFYTAFWDRVCNTFMAEPEDVQHATASLSRNKD